MSDMVSESEILEKLILDSSTPLEYVSPSMQSKLNSWLESIQSPSQQDSIENNSNCLPPASPTRPSDLYSRFGGLSSQSSARSVDDIIIPFSSLNRQQDSSYIGLPSPTLRRYTTYPDVFHSDETAPNPSSEEIDFLNAIAQDPTHPSSYCREYPNVVSELVRVREELQAQKNEFTEYKMRVDSELEELRAKNLEMMSLLEKMMSSENSTLHLNGSSSRDTQVSEPNIDSTKPKVGHSRPPPAPRPATEHKSIPKSDSPLVTQHHRSKVPEDSYPIGFCKHFKNGVCALGDKCKDLHIGKINEKPAASPKINNVKRIIQMAVATHSSSSNNISSHQK